jgi:hypothetical protein
MCVRGSVLFSFLFFFFLSIQRTPPLTLFSLSIPHSPVPPLSSPFHTQAWNQLLLDNITAADHSYQLARVEAYTGPDGTGRKLAEMALPVCVFLSFSFV